MNFQAVKLPKPYSALAFKYLTLKQKKFCFEYLKCKNKSQAAVKAGFNPSYASALLERPIVKTYLKYLMEKIEQQSIIDAAWKLTKLKEIVDGCLNVKSELGGNALARQNDFSSIDPKSALNAIAEMNKMQGDYAEVKTSNKHSFDKQNLVDIVTAMCEY